MKNKIFSNSPIMNFLNLGCGDRFHSEWTNIDCTSTKGSKVISHDLKKGIPFPDASFEVVYHSHLLEHLQRDHAVFFLEECCRVLRPTGVIRVVVPDLEQIIRIYLSSLEKAMAGCKESGSNYDWILLEMFDQMTRNYSGGRMTDYLFRDDIPNESFVVQRLGVRVRESIQTQGKLQQYHRVPSSFIKKTFFLFFKFVTEPTYQRDILCKLLLSSEEYNSLKIGRFRQQGENHQWMYDRYSLADELKKCGFQSVTQRTASESYVEQWVTFNLDTEADGRIYKPDSLYMEAVKPVL